MYYFFKQCKKYQLFSALFFQHCHYRHSATIQSHHPLSLRGVSRGNPVTPPFVIARRQPWQSSNTTFCQCEASAVAIQSYHLLSLRGVSRGNPVTPPFVIARRQPWQSSNNNAKLNWIATVVTLPRDDKRMIDYLIQNISCSDISKLNWIATVVTLPRDDKKGYPPCDDKRDNTTYHAATNLNLLPRAVYGLTLSGNP